MFSARMSLVSFGYSCSLKLSTVCNPNFLRKLKFFLPGKPDL